jgi:hypothetical protein
MDTCFKLIFLYFLLLLVFGTIGNIFIIILCLKKGKRTINYFLSILFLSLNNLAIIYSTELSLIFLPFFKFEIDENSGLWYISPYLIQNLSEEFFSWILVRTSKIVILFLF